MAASGAITINLNGYNGDILQGMVNNMPKEIVLRVFSYLNLQEHGRAFQVNRTWCALASNAGIPDSEGAVWRSGGAFTLNVQPYRAERNLCGVVVTFQSCPISGKVTVTIPKTEKNLCIHIEDQAAIYSSSKGEECLEYYITEETNATVWVWKKEEPNQLWKPASRLRFFSNKVHALPEIIPFENRGDWINGLATKGGTSRVLSSAESWAHQGMYILETRGLIVPSNSGPTIQDLKVMTLFYSGDRSDDVLGCKKQSERRIEEKTASLNCWQFCLLSYIQAGALSWATAGHMYQILDAASRHILVPQALKCGKAYHVDFNDPTATPQPGDILCFSQQVNVDWHCAIFKSHNVQEGTFSYIHCLGIGVHSETCSLDDTMGLTFVRSYDVEDNILNFLAHHQK